VKSRSLEFGGLDFIVCVPSIDGSSPKIVSDFILRKLKSEPISLGLCEHKSGTLVDIDSCGYRAEICDWSSVIGDENFSDRIEDCSWDLVVGSDLHSFLPWDDNPLLEEWFPLNNVKIAILIWGTVQCPDNIVCSGADVSDALVAITNSASIKVNVKRNIIH
jgi:hypothetical protein